MGQAERVPGFVRRELASLSGYRAAFATRAVGFAFAVVGMVFFSRFVGASAKNTPTLQLIQFYIKEALQPFIDLRIASRMFVDVQRVDTQRINVLIQLYRGPKTAVELQYQILWQVIIE